MRKLILGILAVFCVQFAFVIFTTLQSPLDVAVAPIYSDPKTEIPNFEPAETVVADDIDSALPVPGDAAAASDEPTAADERFAARPRSSRPAARPVAIETEQTRIQTPENRPARYFTDNSESVGGAYETVVISYDRSSAISDCQMNEIPKAKKRSYIAKAAPVIKKPWEWIKAVGSKFN